MKRKLKIKNTQKDKPNKPKTNQKVHTQKTKSQLSALCWPVLGLFWSVTGILNDVPLKKKNIFPFDSVMI